MPVRKAKKTLLLVDDDYQLRLLLTMVLGNLEYHVIPAEDGFSALRKLREITPSVILSDLQMPGMSGFEFLSIVRRRFRGVRVIAMSGAYAGKEVPSGVAADAFYQKGNDLDELLDLLQPSEKREQGRRPAPGSHAAAIWIPRREEDSDGRPYVTINCPDCLRSFRLFSDAQCSSLQQTVCHHCSNRITFALVEESQHTYRSPEQVDRQISTGSN